MNTRLVTGSKLTVILALLLTIIFSTTAAHAADNSTDAPKFGIKPATPGTPATSKGYFILKGQPGEAISDAVIVSNPGTVPVKLVLYAVDATNGDTGGISYYSQASKPTDVGAWVAISNTAVELPAKTQLTVPFTINVPKEAGNGQHLGGIAAQLVNDSNSGTTATNQNQASMSVKTVTRALTAVQVNVGDAAPILSLAITGAKLNETNGQKNLSIDLKNNGNTMVQPKGEVTFTDATGKVTLNAPVALNNILPGNNITYPVEIGNLTAGTYKVHASLDFGNSNPAVYDSTIEIKAPAASQALPVIGKVVASPTPATVATTVAASTDNSSMLLGILIGFGAMVVIGGLGLGGFMLMKRGKAKPLG